MLLSSMATIKRDSSTRISNEQNSKVNVYEDSKSKSASRLCERCQSLDLTPDKFVAFDKTVPPSSTQYLIPKPHTSRRPSSLKSWPSKRMIGTFDEISKNAKSSKPCPLCLLIIASTFADVHRILKLGICSDTLQCFLEWEVDGVPVHKSHLKQASIIRRTRHLRISWTQRYFSEAYLLFVTPISKLLEPRSMPLGNAGTSLPEDKVDSEISKLACLRSWLDHCCKTHGKICNNYENDAGEFDEDSLGTNLGVIDVIDLRLTSLPLQETYSTLDAEGANEPPLENYLSQKDRSSRSQSLAPYIALSYLQCDFDKSFQTTRANVMQRREKGGLASSLVHLPKVMQDAMALVGDLGYRYLWIDLLCVVQDSKYSQTLHSKALPLIYGNALLTVISADYFDATRGLEAMHTFGESCSQGRQDCGSGVQLVVHQPLETTLRLSWWYRCAFRLQERLFSRRCLVFTGGRVYFQCSSITASEYVSPGCDSVGGLSNQGGLYARIMRELVYQPFAAYMSSVRLFTFTKWTGPKEILTAFGGLSTRYAKATGAPLLFGLPTSHFDLAILWTPHSMKTEESAEGQSDVFTRDFPSWSWCGWPGVSSTYTSDVLQDCVVDPHAWLSEHTWICWYIRDGLGRLRPLWDAKKATAIPQDAGTERKWQGYPALAPGSKTPLDLNIRPRKSDSGTIRTEKDGNGTPSSQQCHLYQSRCSHQANPSERPQNDVRAQQLESSNNQQAKWSPELEQSKEDEGMDGLDAVSEHGPDNDFTQHKKHVENFKCTGNEHSRGRCLQFGHNPPSVKPLQTSQDYGRISKDDIKDKTQKCFNLTLPEYPYRVVMTDYTALPSQQFLDLPFLQFWTWYDTFELVKRCPTGEGIMRYDIADYYGDWCGTIELPLSWQPREDTDGKAWKQSFIALSDAKAFSLSECEAWTYYLPKERDQSEWDVYNVMLIEQRDYFWERVGIGKIFKDAFMRKEWKEIVLG